ncbi:MAG: hypothetical protein KBT12_06175 [Bacteroidales bacterium]|nr:hypothetical protein [Candidatus Physcousia equi]
MKKFFTHKLIACAAVLAICSSANAQRTLTLNTYSSLNFEKITSDVSTVRLTRNLFAGYNTICLPFSVSADELQTIVGEGMMLEKLVKAEKGQLTFLDVTEEGIQAGMPYLIYSPQAKNAIFSTNDLQMTTEPITLQVGEASMSGMYAPTQEMDLFGIPAQQDSDLLQSILIRTVADKTFLPTRCSINYVGSEETPVILHVTTLDNITTPIAQLKAQNTKVDIYTVGGSLVKAATNMNEAAASLPKGIYVVNGQKFMVK